MNNRSIGTSGTTFFLFGGCDARSATTGRERTGKVNAFPCLFEAVFGGTRSVNMCRVPLLVRLLYPQPFKDSTAQERPNLGQPVRFGRLAYC